MSLLPKALHHTYSSIIIVSPQRLFERCWTFVEEAVVVSKDVITFRFNPNTKTPGPFELQFSYVEHDEMKPRSLSRVVDSLGGTYSIRISEASYGTAILRLDDSLAYSGLLDFRTKPI